MMHIAFCADGNFLKPLEIALFSVLTSSRQPSDLHFHILQLEKFCEKNIQALANQFGATLSFYSLETELYAKGRFSPAMYGRLYLPLLLDTNIHKVIYLDCDIVVANDISELWLTDICSYDIAAVPEIKSPIKDYLLKKFCLEDYFNSGVLLINLDSVRKNNSFHCVIQYIEKNTALLYPDQDALNSVLSQRWLALPDKWNQMSLTLYERPMIVHYALSKPWKDNRNKNGYLYHALLSKYPFKLPYFPQEHSNKSIFNIKETKLYSILSFYFWKIKALLV